MGIWLRWVEKIIIQIFSNLKVSKSVALGKKLKYFTDQNGPKGDHMKMNCEYFQIQK